MSIDPELQRYIRKEIAKQMNVILSGVSGENTVLKETIQQLYPGTADMLDRPKMHPYGFASRARVGAISVVGKQGENPANRIVLGHRDAEAPDDLAEGTSKMYSAAGYQIYASEDGVYLGNGSADIAFLLGDDTNDFLGQLVDLIAKHVHGPPGSPPTTSAQFTQMKTQTIDPGKLLSTEEGGLG